MGRTSINSSQEGTIDPTSAAAVGPPMENISSSSQTVKSGPSRRNTDLSASDEVRPLTSSPMSLYSPHSRQGWQETFLVGRTYRGDLTRYDSKSREFFPFLSGISAEYADFSKDGQWVAYTSYPEGTIWRSKLDGSQRLQLTYPPLYAVMPRWSPDGKKIIFFEFPESSSKPASMYEYPPKVEVPDSAS